MIAIRLSPAHCGPVCLIPVLILALFLFVGCQSSAAGPARPIAAEGTEKQAGLAISLPILPQHDGATGEELASRGELRIRVVSQERDGRTVFAAMAESPGWNEAGHKVEWTGARTGRFTGRHHLAVTINPDQWLPADGEAIHADIRLDITRGGSDAGNDSYRVRYRAELEGHTLEGQVAAEPWLIESSSGPKVITLWLENAMPGGNSWWRQVELQVWVDDDRVTRARARGGVLSSHRWRNIEPDELSVADRVISGKLAIPLGAPERYMRVTLDGSIVGDRAIARWQGRQERGESVIRREGVARGTLRPVNISERAGIEFDIHPPEWLAKINWENRVDITRMEGEDWNERFEHAQDALGEEGGVVYFPAGEYDLNDHLRLRNGVVAMGAEPRLQRDARSGDYELGTRLRFPRYQLSMEGEGTPLNTAFKGVRLADPVGGRLAGVMLMDIDHGTVHLGQRRGFARHAREGELGGQWLVYGNILRHAASPLYSIPTGFQHPWQRWTDRYTAAIHCWAGDHVWIANNRIAESGEDNFVMEGFRISTDRPATHQRIRDAEITTLDELVFDYDNRPGIIVNGEPLGDGLQIWRDWEKITDPPTEGSGTTLPPPHGLAPGIRIEGNFIFSTGAAAITSSGDGTYIGENIIRFRPRVIRATSDGATLSNFTNNNRAIEVRGWRWTVHGNDYEVYSNYGITGVKFNDGEGIMHEAWVNVDIRDSRIINNRGNAYICIWRVPVRGLRIEGNHIRAEGIPAIFVLGQTNRDVNLACENVEILNNITEGRGIKVVGRPGPGNRIIGNQQRGAFRHARVENHVHAQVRDNTGYLP